jgi:hypothetical protein
VNKFLRLLHSPIVLKFLTNENAKPAEILTRLGAQFGDETLSRIQVYDWSKSFKVSRMEVGNMRRHLLQGKLRPAFLRLVKASYSSIF